MSDNKRFFDKNEIHVTGRMALPQDKEIFFSDGAENQSGKSFMSFPLYVTRGDDVVKYDIYVNKPELIDQVKGLENSGEMRGKHKLHIKGNPSCTLDNEGHIRQRIYASEILSYLPCHEKDNPEQTGDERISDLEHEVTPDKDLNGHESRDHDERSR